MAVKRWMLQLRPTRLYLTLAFTVALLVSQLVVSYTTHALTLLIEAYHSLCNVIALGGCIITVKYSSDESGEEDADSNVPSSCEDSLVKSPQLDSRLSTCCEDQDRVHTSDDKDAAKKTEKRLKNTFGWARIDILVMLIVCVFLASSCFSLLVEAIQTLIHIGHQDEMHHPLVVLLLGVVGLLVNGLCYVCIGGYTFHQASFLHLTPSGDVVLDHNVTEDSVQQGRRRLSTQTRKPEGLPRRPTRQGPWEMCRDTIGCVLVIVCALCVYYSEDSVAKFVDPSFSILSALSLLILSYPYMKESGLILLQTIPDTIDIHSLHKKLLQEFPDIVNVHDLHVWRLTASRVFFTAHIIFRDPNEYLRTNQRITDFFQEQGITQVTIQPEFFKPERSDDSTASKVQKSKCLVQCDGPACESRHCCAPDNKELKGTRKAFKRNSYHLDTDPSSYEEPDPPVSEPKCLSIKKLPEETSFQPKYDRNGLEPMPKLETAMDLAGQPDSLTGIKNVTSTNCEKDVHAIIEYTCPPEDASRHSSS